MDSISTLTDSNPFLPSSSSFSSERPFAQPEVTFLFPASISAPMSGDRDLRSDLSAYMLCRWCQLRVSVFEAKLKADIMFG